MPNDQIPLVIYFEGEVQASQTLYTYRSSVALKIVGYRVFSRDGTTMDLEVRKNGTLLDVIEITSQDTNHQDLPGLSFAKDDILTITTPATLPDPLEGLTIIFDCDITDAVDNSSETNLKRIQTPLIARYEGELIAADTFFYYKPSQRIEIFRYQIALRNSANAQTTISILKGGTIVTQAILPSGSTYAEGLIDAYFEVGEELTLRITTCGSSPNFGESLLLLLDYRNTSQTTFSSFQTPFVVEYEGLDDPESNSVLRYHVPRTLTVAALQVFLREAIAENLQIGIYKNGVSQTSFSLVAGQTTSSPVESSIGFVEGDYLQATVLSPTTLSSGLILTIDYFIGASSNASTFNYYSDPDTDIVILARQVGFGAAKADAISFENLEKYKKDVDNILNGRLRALYRTPLAKVAGGNNPWPGAVQAIAQRMTLRLLMNDIYSEIEPNTSINVSNQAQIAQEDLQLILNKETLLEGQRLRDRNYGSNPCTSPLREPGAAATSTNTGFPRPYLT